MPRQVSAEMYWGIAHGRISSVRNSVRPSTGPFNMSASKTPTMTCPATLTTVQISDFPSNS